MKLKQTTARLEPQTYARLDALAREQGKPVNAIFTAAVESYLEAGEVATRGRQSEGFCQMVADWLTDGAVSKYLRANRELAEACKALREAA